MLTGSRVTLLSNAEVLLEGELSRCQDALAACQRLGIRSQRVCSIDTSSNHAFAAAGPIDLWLVIDARWAISRISEIRTVGFHGSIYVVGLANDGPELEAAILNAGADGYSPTGIDRDTLAARLRAMLRRESSAYLPANSTKVALRRRERLLIVGAKAYALTPREFTLLDYLRRRAGQWVPRDQLLHEVFGPQTGYDPSLARTHILRIRKKLVENSWLLRTDRLAGVMLVSAIEETR